MLQPGLRSRSRLRELAAGRRERTVGVRVDAPVSAIWKVRQAGGALACRKNPGNTMILDPCFDLGNALPFALNFKPQRIGILLQLEGT